MQFVDKPLARPRKPADRLSKASLLTLGPAGQADQLPRLLLQLLSTHRHLKPAWSVAIAYTIGSFER